MTQRSSRAENTRWDKSDRRPIDVQVTASLRLMPDEITAAGGNLAQAAQNLLGPAGAAVIEAVER